MNERETRNLARWIESTYPHIEIDIHKPIPGQGWRLFLTNRTSGLGWLVWKADRGHIARDGLADPRQVDPPAAAKTAPKRPSNCTKQTMLF